MHYLQSNFPFKNYALLTTFLFSANVAHAAISPLVNEQQKALDQRAVQINQNWNYPVLKAEAKAAYVAAHGSPLSPEAKSRLDLAINELAFSALQKAVNDDPYYPKVYWLNTAPHQASGVAVAGGRYSYDNTDTIYRTIPISGDGEYVVYGKRNNVAPTDVTFSLIKNPNSQQTIAYLSGKDLVVNADGSYAITIDNKPANGRKNHIQSNSTAKQLFIRNTLGNWNTETPDTLRVKRVNSVPKNASPETNLQIGAKAWKNLQESVVTYGVGALGLKTYSQPVNTLANPTSSSTLGTLVSQSSSFGHFKLADDEGLVVTVNSGGANYFVVPVTDPWAITVDPVNHQSSLNNKQSVANADGTYTYVISPKDAGVYNWIDTADLHEGTIMARWQGLPDGRGTTGWPAISAQVIKLNQLKQVLPVDTRYVTAAERAIQLEARRQGYQRRLQ